MPFQDFQLDVPTTPFGANLRASVVSRGRKPSEFADEQEASNFVRLSALTEKGVAEGLAPEDIAMQAQQLGIPTGPLAGETVSPAYDPTVPAYARGYAESFKAREADAARRAIPAGAAGGWASNLVNAAEAAQAAEAQAMQAPAPLANATVGQAPEAPEVGVQVASDAPGEYTPPPPNLKQFGIVPDPTYASATSGDPRRDAAKRRTAELVSQKSLEQMRRSGSRTISGIKTLQIAREAEFEAAEEVGYEVKRNNLGQAVKIDLNTPIKKGVRPVISPDGDQYEVDVHEDSAGRIIRTLGSRLTVPGPATRTQREVDKLAAKEVQDYTTNRRPGMEGNIRSLEQASAMLEESSKGFGMASGSVVGPMADIPVVGRAVFRPNKNIKARIEQAGIAGMRAALGSAFTAQENKDFLSRNFDDYATEKENLIRLDNLKQVLLEVKAAKDSQAEWFLKNGTMKGYKGPVPPSSADEIYSARDAKAKERGVKPIAGKAPATEGSTVMDLKEVQDFVNAPTSR